MERYSNFLEQSEGSFIKLQDSLVRASRMPYNNATIAYHAAGVEPDLRFGGSCLDKLRCLTDNLPSELSSKVRVISSDSNSLTHFAMLVKLGESEYYCDPYLWQVVPMATDLDAGSTAPTLFDFWFIRKDSGLDSLELSIAFVSKMGRKVESRLGYIYDGIYECLPPLDSFMVRPELPKFFLNIPGRDRTTFYKIWYLKQEKSIGDIWVTKKNGYRVRLSVRGVNAEGRRVVMSEIEELIGASEQEICEYFDTARQLELKKIDVNRRIR